MKSKSVIILIVLLSCSSVFAQEKNLNKIKFRSFSVACGGYWALPSTDISTSFGFCVNPEATFSHKNNLVAIGFLSGEEFVINIFGGPTNATRILELNAMYGRELKINNWFAIAGFAGVGLYYQNKYLVKEESKSQFGFFTTISSVNKSYTGLSIPLKLDILFQISKHFRLGLSPSYNINNLNNISALSVIGQYRL